MAGQAQISPLGPSQAPSRCAGSLRWAEERPEDPEGVRPLRSAADGRPMDIAVICIGNEYQLDDGFGPTVARYLVARYSFPENVRVLDRAVMGYAIVPDLMEVDAVVVVDALDGTGAEPGTVLAFDPEDASGAGEMMSLHQIRFADVLSAARFMGARCATGRCFGVQVADTGAGALERGLTAPVAAAVQPCAEAVVAYLARSMNCAVTEKAGGDLLK